jgi:hypothetical protein
MRSKHTSRTVALVAAMGGTILSTAGAAQATPALTYLWCYADSLNRDLPFQIGGNDPTMSAETCVPLCKAHHFAYAGTQDGNQCWCGDSYGSEGMSSSCTTPCGGNSAEKCGGPWANSVFATGVANFMGCYADSASRDLPTQIGGNDPGMTPGKCVSLCYDQHFAYADDRIVGVRGVRRGARQRVRLMAAPPAAG